MEIAEIASLKPTLFWRDPLVVALSVLAGKTRRSPYRVVVTDYNMKVKGVLTGRRVLEVLLGRRGTSLREREGIKGILREPVGLFIDEARHLFVEDTPLQAVLQYMAENEIGQVVVVNQVGGFRGIVDEECLLRRLIGKKFGIRVSEVMSETVHSIPPEINLLEAAHMMVDLMVRRLVVLREKTPLGVLTVTDILNYVLAKEMHIEMLLYDLSVEEALETKVEQVMSKEVLSVAPESDLGEAIDATINNDVSGLVVVDSKGEVAGVISRIDMLSGLVRSKGAPAVLEMLVK